MANAWAGATPFGTGTHVTGTESDCELAGQQPTSIIQIDICCNLNDSIQIMDRALHFTPAAAPYSLGLKPMVVALAMTFGMTVGGAAQAANYTVTNLNDAGPGSLRQALADANANSGADTIDFAAGLTGTITLTSGELNVSDSVTLQGPGPNLLTISGNNASRVLYLYNGASLLDVTISGLTISQGAANNGAGIFDNDENLTLDNVVLSGNKATVDGGGLWADGFSMTLTVRNSTITGNTSGQNGGGIYVEDTGGLLLIRNSTISNNQAAKHGGGIYFYDPDHDVTIEGSTISGNVAGQRGGGIYFYSADNGNFTIRDSAITGNRAQHGGGIFLYEVDQPTTIENTTISGNVATGDGGGLNVGLSYANNLKLVNVTIAENVAAGKGGGILHHEGESTLANVLVAGNSAASQADGNDIFNDTGQPAVLNATNSLIQDAPSGTINGSSANNLLNVSPMLGPLQNNGGSTQTHALLDGSPAIDAGASPSSLSTDQRGTGFARTVGSSPDIGAFEWRPTLSIAGTATVTEGQAASFTITLSAASSGPSSIVVTPTGSGSSPAVAGTHFDATPITVVVPAGSTTATVLIPTFAATPSGAGRSLTATMTSAVDGAIGSADNASTMLVAVPSELSITGPSTVTAGQAATFNIQLNTVSANPITVTVTPTGTGPTPAVAGTDFDAIPQTITIAAGSQSFAVSIPTFAATPSGGGRSFSVALSNATGGSIGAASTASVTLVAIAQPVLSISGPSTVEAGQAGSFNVLLSQAPSSPVTVTVTPAGTGTSPALAGTDFDASPITITIPAGTISFVVKVPTLVATPSGAGRTFSVTLGNATGATIGSVASANVTLTASASNPTPVPTLSQWALALLTGMLGFAARRRRKP
ncbi:IPTL-CTERM sorting domain-containing protein (plasmid) [Diaphorobacter sp. HDW4B]|uniref:IPTL-CTERM sorting domain-containing protein n=1 Tax=Diaphorobacter sp. HDW4B TaxID=2714925 RepID=UPI00140CF4AA|nr:IPTL-CTERM sorting domain-containing protein [Diaphorobacter sp. HDW4B]QIL73929.1 IPTL-CTERM sorting domain-containing protein [Diaphorobacter sp. HDW4B]